MRWRSIRLVCQFCDLLNYYSLEEKLASVLHKSVNKIEINIFGCQKWFYKKGSLPRLKEHGIAVFIFWTKTKSWLKTIFSANNLGYLLIYPIRICSVEHYSQSYFQQLNFRLTFQAQKQVSLCGEEIYRVEKSINRSDKDEANPYVDSEEERDDSD